MKDFQAHRLQLIEKHVQNMSELDREEELHKKLPLTFSGRSFVIMHGYTLRESGETGYFHIEPTIEEASEILGNFPAIEFGLGYFIYNDEKVDIPLYMINITSGAHDRSFRISWSIGNGFTINMKLDYRSFLDAGLLVPGERKATETEHVHFMGTKREDLTSIRIETVEFSKRPVLTYYGGHRKMIDPVRIQEFLDFINQKKIQ